MRQISQATLNILSEQRGIEPIILVRVAWTPGIVTTYADRKFEQLGIVGRVLELSNLENVVNISKSSNSEAVTIKLDDSDGTIKSIFDVNNIHMVPVYIYQWFAGVPLSEAFIIFEGELSTPITWKEGERTITFDVLSNVYNQEVGFSAEEGDFEYVPSNLIGVAWPLPFGSPLRVPSLKVNEIGTNVVSASASDTNNNNMDSYNQALAKATECYQKAAWCFARADELQSKGVPATQVFVLPSLSAIDQTAVTTVDQYLLSAAQYQDQALEYVAQMQQILSSMSSNNTLTTSDANGFDQGDEQTVTINGVTYTGTFSGSTFTTDGGVTFAGNTGGALTVSDGDVATQYSTDNAEQAFFYTLKGVSNDTNNETIYYIVSLFEVTNVVVYSKYDNITTQVPSDYYSLYYVDFGSIQATYLVFSKALSLIDSKWSDSVFCDMTSPVGPAVTDILIWLIGQYTDKTYDLTSFQAVYSQIYNLPANFVLTTRGNVLNVLKEIAFQARCAIYQKEGVFYLTCLAYEQDPIATISEEDIEFGTMEISCSDTEELVTKYTSTYKIFNNEDDDKVIWRFNISKYGLIEKEEKFYIYNSAEAVEHASIFWFIRYCMTWKKLKFSTFLTKLNIETFDSILINFSRPWVASSSIVGVVESCSFNSADQRIQLEVWLPVRFGEMIPYPFANPLATTPTLTFPLTYEASSGTTTGTSAGNGAALYPQTGTKRTSRANMSSGGISPSDVNLSIPDVVTQLSANELSQKQAKQLANSQKQYTIKKIKEADLSFDAPGTYPGYVTGQKEGKVYYVDVYFQGLSGSATQVEVTQLAINDLEIIPTGTPTTVLKNKIKTGVDPVTGLTTYVAEYTMNVPVWLVSDTTTSTKQTDSSTTDSGTDETDTTSDSVPETDSGDENLGAGGEF